MAAEGRPSPVRRAAPVFGSVSVTNCWVATVVGPNQVVPPSEDETKPTLKPRGVNLGGPVVWNCSKKSYRTPVLGSTTITLPMVALFCPGSKIARVPVQVLPPSVVLENQAGPRDARARSTASGLWLGDLSRSHTT